MGMKETFKTICESLGKSNKPTYAVMAIAFVKGIARPTFTMLDKTEDPETKKYTALREGLTEVVAIPTYWACGELTSKFAKKMNLTEDKLAAAEHNLMFLGVCMAALFIIPAVTSLTIKPLLKKLKNKKNDEMQNSTLDITNKAEEVVIKEPPYVKTNVSKNRVKSLNYMPVKMANMKVGGIW